MNFSSTMAVARRQPMDANTRVLVVDDHVFIAQLLREFVRRLEGFECVGSAVNGREAIKEIERLLPDIVVTDLDMPMCGGLEIVNELHACKSDIKILIFSGLTNFEAVRHALQNGVQGYLEKGIELDEFPKALKAVRDGDFYVSPSINQHLRRIVRQSLNDPLLDRTEMKVLRLFAEDVPIKAIAAEVDLSQSGVYKVITRLRTRVGSGDDRDMRDFAAQLGLSRGWRTG